MVNLHSYVAPCDKNPGHTAFIPTKTFTKERLPVRYHDDDIVDVVKLLAEVTVRIAVKVTSPARPDKLPGTDVPYPCYDLRGTKTLRTGTGYAGQVILRDAAPCPCEECRTADVPCDRWSEIHVTTSQHLVFDDIEAKKTAARFWFDDDKSLLVSVNASQVLESDIEADRCVVMFITHDIQLAMKLKETLSKLEEMRAKVNEKYGENDKLVVIVSHPHGCSKQVTVGEWEVQEVEKGKRRFAYTAPTCPGSGGAPVFVLSSKSQFFHTHSGTDNRLNYSSLC
ncbi:uncharacterized protein LOC131950364 [Physella acuta]|uniref:uncharacterized protein LOC131950364 n=1 Tax=Physella acuta TaxID=109671 RepID=UPI0027DD3840|nr:uncharacterized protein LOC131950364 [Physella acuta]